MGDTMTFPKTVEEFMEEYKIVDSDQVYTNGAELVPIFRMKQWFEHINATSDAVPVCRCKDCDMWNKEDFSGRKSLGNYRCVCAVWSNFEDGRRVYTGSDEFCSRGERKGGDE